MINEIKVILSPTRPPRVASVVGKQIFYDELSEGETLVTHDGFSGKYKPDLVKGVWVETATSEEIAEIESKIVRPKEKITLDGLDILEVADLLRWVGAI